MTKEKGKKQGIQVGEIEHMKKRDGDRRETKKKSNRKEQQRPPREREREREIRCFEREHKRKS